MMLIYSFAINQFINTPTKHMMKRSLDSTSLTNNNKKESLTGNDFFCGQEMFSGMEVELCREEQFVTGT